jgi:hypothetical protein
MENAVTPTPILGCTRVRIARWESRKLNDALYHEEMNLSARWSNGQSPEKDGSYPSDRARRGRRLSPRR